MVEAKLQSPFVLVYLKGDGKSQFSPRLEQPEFVELGGRMFLTGRLAPTKGYWCAGARALFAVEDISGMIEFDSYEAYEAAARRYRKGPKPGWRFLWWTGGES